MVLFHFVWLKMREKVRRRPQRGHEWSNQTMVLVGGTSRPYLSLRSQV